MKSKKNTSKKSGEGENQRPKSQKSLEKPRRRPFVNRKSRELAEVKETKPTQKTVSKATPKTEDGGMRLNRYVAQSGVCSRRKADELIKEGKVSVNGKVVVEMGHRVQPRDIVVYGGKRLSPEKKMYLLLNKPKNVICTTSDPQGRKTVIDMVKGVGVAGLYPVGRLDRHTTGLIVVTNDGELAQRVAHPRYEMSKLYVATLDKPLVKKHLEELVAGVKLEEGMARADEVAYVNGKAKNEIGIALHIGWNRVVRRMFMALGYKVEKLDRILLGSLSKKDLPRGRFRELTNLEISLLKKGNKAAPKSELPDNFDDLGEDVFTID